jgi:hypothetical protein
MDASSELDHETRARLVDVFRRYRVDPGEVFVAAPISPDEAIFVVKAPVFPEATLTRELMDLLNRKVWVTSDDPAWAGRIRPLC